MALGLNPSNKIANLLVLRKKVLKMPKAYTKQNGKNAFIPDEKRFLFNVDTLYYSAFSVNYNEVMQDGLLLDLEVGKEHASKFEGDLHTIDVKLPRYNHNIIFEILPNGKTAYSYQIRNEDFAFYFAKENSGSNFPIYVQLNQFKLWKDGVVNAYMETLEILALLGFKVLQCKPSRIDLCCHSDQFQWLVTDLKKLSSPINTSQPDFFKLNPLTMEFETVMYGKRNYNQLRIYNKTTELFAKQKYHFLQVYEEYGLTGEVWNIEFEIHRKFLKNISVDGEKDFFDSMDNLISEKGLSILWTEMTNNRFSHSSPFWKTLQKGDKQKFYSTNSYMTRIKDIDDSKDREASQILGRLKKFVLNKEENDLNTAIKEFLTYCYEEKEDKINEFEDIVKIKKQKFVAKEINNLLDKKKPNSKELD